jgi:hypothetical protein
MCGRILGTITMVHSIPRAIAVALLGALAGAACLVGAFAWNPAVTLEMDRPLPEFATGFHPPERDRSLTFVWTSERADVVLAGLDRRVPWTCSVRFRGARAAGEPQPDLRLAIDGVDAGAWPATNAFRTVEAAAPPTPGSPGLTLTLISTATFVPGGDDARRLGVQVDSLSCRPTSGIVLPPRRALGAVALAAALLGAGFALAGITAASAIGAAALMAAGQALAAISWGALFGSYLATVVRLAFWMACAMTGLVALLEFARKSPFRNTARFAITFSAGALYLQLLALLHPSKPVVDAAFHAHRFGEVLAGRFYFTQLSTSATPFPYAIGLYLFAAPWAALTGDHIALLRIVVSATEIVAGALLYAMAVRSWGNRLAAAVAVALFSLVPLSYGIIGNANLTNAFGQAVSIVAVAAAMLAAERLKNAGPFVCVAALVTLGLMSHVSTLVLLTSTLVAMAVLFYLFGAEPLRGSSRRLLLLTFVSLLVATALYWGHFGDVYSQQIARLRAPAAKALDEGATVEGPGRAAAGRPRPAAARPRGTYSMAVRVSQAIDQTAANFGWPMLVLALVGFWRLTVEGARDRLSLVIGAWGAVTLAFVAFSVLSPGSQTYQQDAFEFIGRVEHATMPGVVLLAARGAIWAWRAGRTLRIASGTLLACAVVIGVRAWLGWLQ